MIRKKTSTLSVRARPELIEKINETSKKLGYVESSAFIREVLSYACHLDKTIWSHIKMYVGMLDLRKELKKK